MNRKARRRQNVFVAIFAAVLMLMSVGFAVYQQELDINGVTTLSPNKWSVHFADLAGASDSVVNHKEGNTTDVGITLSDDATSLTVNPFTLKEPGDSYSLTIGLTNDGTIDARYLGVELSNIPESLRDIVSIIVLDSHVHDGQLSMSYPLRWGAAYDDDPIFSSMIFEPYIIPANKAEYTQTVSIGIEFVEPSDPQLLPKEEVLIEPVFTLKFEAA